MCNDPAMCSTGSGPQSRRRMIRDKYDPVTIQWIRCFVAVRHLAAAAQTRRGRGADCSSACMCGDRRTALAVCTRDNSGSSAVCGDAMCGQRGKSVAAAMLGGRCIGLLQSVACFPAGRTASCRRRRAAAAIHCAPKTVAARCYCSMASGDSGYACRAPRFCRQPAPAVRGAAQCRCKPPLCRHDASRATASGESIGVQV